MSQRKIIIHIINVVTGIAQFLLGLRFILKLFSANPSTPFVQWIYTTSSPLLYPFKGIFPTTSLDGTFIIEFSALFAFIIYTILGYVFVNVVSKFSK